MASAAACLMFSGVSKSGSPGPKSTTSKPSARIASAAIIAFSVEEARIRATLSETGKGSLAVFVCIIGFDRERARHASGEAVCSETSCAALVKKFQLREPPYLELLFLPPFLPPFFPPFFEELL